jgi:glucose/arabinose dehydrogenase
VAYSNGSLYFGGLKGQALYEAVLDGTSIKEVKPHLQNEFGRIRDVVLGPDAMLYITTSNNDSRGTPVRGDDKIIMVNPLKL